MPMHRHGNWRTGWRSRRRRNDLKHFMNMNTHEKKIINIHMKTGNTFFISIKIETKFRV